MLSLAGGGWLLPQWRGLNSPLIPTNCRPTSGALNKQKNPGGMPSRLGLKAISICRPSFNELAIRLLARKVEKQDRAMHLVCWHSFVSFDCIH